jgi:glutaconate CoA-transferase subunit B
VTIDDVRTNMGWDPRLSGALDETPPPTEDELRLIRTQLDPSGMYTS